MKYRRVPYAWVIVPLLLLLLSGYVYQYIVLCYIVCVMLPLIIFARAPEHVMTMMNQSCQPGRRWSHAMRREAGLRKINHRGTMVTLKDNLDAKTPQFPMPFLFGYAPIIVRTIVPIHRFKHRTLVWNCK